VASREIQRWRISCVALVSLLKCPNTGSTYHRIPDCQPCTILLQNYFIMSKFYFPNAVSVRPSQYHIYVSRDHHTVLLKSGLKTPRF